MIAELLIAVQFATGWAWDSQDVKDSYGTVFIIETKSDWDAIKPKTNDFVVFSSPRNCKPCEKYRPDVEKIAAEFPNTRVIIVHNDRYAASNGVSSYPTSKFGKKKFFGPIPINLLRNIFRGEN